MDSGNAVCGGGVEIFDVPSVTTSLSEDSLVGQGGVTFTSPYSHPNGRLGDANTWYADPRKKFGSSRSVDADAYFRFIRREARVPDITVGTDSRLVFEVTPSANPFACGREITYSRGYREDGKYLRSELAGRLFICSRRGTLQRVPLLQSDGEQRSGGLHDSLVLVLPDEAGVMIDRCEWPSEYIPDMDQLSRLLSYAVNLSRGLRKELTPARYANLLGSRFRPASQFGEAVVVLTKLLMLQNVAVYHLVDAPSLFVNAYCGVTNGKRDLAMFLRGANKRVDYMRPHAWALGTVSQMMGAVPDVSLPLSQFCRDYNRYARNSGPVLTGAVLRNSVDRTWLGEANINVDELEHVGRESYSAYLARIAVIVAKLSAAVGGSFERRKTLLICKSVLDEAMKVDSLGVDVYNSKWSANNWRVGQFAGIEQYIHDIEEA